MSTPQSEANKDGQSTGLALATGSVRLRPWREYPVGSKAHAIGGGLWYRTAQGWKWNGPDGCGSTFPTPGADAFVVTLPGAEIVGRI